MKNLGQCQIEGCNRRAVCAVYKKFPNGQKVWLHVCAHHEQMIGDENMNMGKNYVFRR